MYFHLQIPQGNSYLSLQSKESSTNKGTVTDAERNITDSLDFIKDIPDYVQIEEVQVRYKMKLYTE